MSDNLLFSVIIPTYNRADFIRTTVHSVLGQTYSNYEIIIVDDGSTDDTAQVVNSIVSDKIQYFLIKNSERGVARNFGISHAKGDYITFLDSDDILYPDYLNNAVEGLKRYNFPDFFHLAYESKSVKTGHSLHRYGIKNDDIYSLVKGNHLSCIGIFLKKQITDQFRFNEDRNLSGSEDWELWLRLAAHYGIKTDDRVSAALMVHDARSVLGIDERKLPERKILALKYAFEDEAVQRVFGSYRKAMEAYCFTYIALHLVLSGQNVKALSYQGKALAKYPLSVFNIRSLAIAKLIFLNLIRMRK